jgi:hypothetical protein
MKLVKETLFNSIKEGFFIEGDAKQLADKYGTEIEELTGVTIHLNIHPGVGVEILFDSEAVFTANTKEPRIIIASYLGGVLDGIKRSK